MKNFLAFTYSPQTKVKVLKTTVNVSANKQINPNFTKEKDDYVAIWDTGATNTVISKDLANQLHLNPIGKTKVSTAGGICEANNYIVDLLLPNRLHIKDCLVTSGILGEGVDFLIGMDVITLGDFSVTNVDNATTFSFRYPSCETIDYVNQAKKMNKKNLEIRKKEIEKKGKCPCGSGKKYRYCCGKAELQKIKKKLEKVEC